MNLLKKATINSLLRENEYVTTRVEFVNVEVESELRGKKNKYINTQETQERKCRTETQELMNFDPAFLLT